MRKPSVEKIERLKLELAAEELALKEWNAIHGEKEKVATLLHDTFCNWNHTDGCVWHYETKKSTDGKTIPDWSGHAHKSYLNKVDDLILKIAKLRDALNNKEGYELIKAWVENFVGHGRAY